jgi:4'-phosphopantetheinyl transferase
MKCSETMPLDRQDVHVWSCDLSQYDGEQVLLAGLLSVEERSRAARFVFDRDRRHFTLSHGLLRMILGRYLRQAPELIQFEKGSHGKPAICGPSSSAQSIQFSLSHSGDYALLAVALGRAVGVDVELCRPEVDSLKLADRFFAAAESRKIAEVPVDRQQQMFYRYWTAKEAYLKGRGLGLSLGLDRFELLFDELSARARVRSTESGTIDEAWLVRSLSLSDGLVGSLAAEGGGWRVQMVDARLSLFR